ncbi:SPASM domain-containing protein [Patescibacteria group bacterium]|nr:SPASM domain-containing protein [Patescibacteria group bacterium]MBU4078507.1 SPASM domain-containing protein [Patescibacteria group bacterium]
MVNYQRYVLKISSIERKHLIFQIVNENSSLVNRGGSVKVKTLKTLVDCRIQDIFIRADGDVRFCCNDYYCEVRLGNVNQSKLINIWNSTFYRKIRNEIKRGIFNLEICKKCHNKKYEKEI